MGVAESVWRVTAGRGCEGRGAEPGEASGHLRIDEENRQGRCFEVGTTR